MSRTLSAVIGLVSLAVGAAAAHDARSFAGFLAGTLLLGAAAFVVLSLLVVAVRQAARGEFRKAMRLVLAAVSLSVLGALAAVVLMPYELVAGIPPPRFRTNILTGRCQYGGEGEHLDPWYYRRACTVPREEKLRLVLQSGSGRRLRAFCQRGCPELPAGCTHFALLAEGERFTCTDFVQ